MKFAAVEVLLVAVVGLFAACGPVSVTGTGLVVTNPTDPARPFFHDLGTVRRGEKREHTFELENRSSEEVTILSVQGRCACTKVRVLRCFPAGGPPIDANFEADEELLRVPPGTRVEMTIRVDTTKIRANVDKLAVMRARTSSSRTPFLDFELHIKGEAPFLVDPDEIRIGNIPRSHGGAGQATIMTGVVGGQAMIVDVIEHSERVEPTLEYLFLNDEHIWTLTARITENQELGPIREVVTLSTTDANGQGNGGRLAVVVWANVVEDVVFEPRRLQFAPIGAGEAGTVTGRLRALVPGMSFRLLRGEVEGEGEGDLAKHFDVRFESVIRGGGERSFEWRVTVDARPGLPAGRFDGILRLFTDDAQHPEIRVSFSGVVR
ncbi:MAG: DUF1573 domain-containing protein [bacterium]|nr:DUF1573 domain-containing protein [bacterium]